MAFAATVIASVKRLIRILQPCIPDCAGAIVIISDISPIRCSRDKCTVFGVYCMIPLQISIVAIIIMFHRDLLSYVLGTSQDMFRNLYINYRRYLNVIQEGESSIFLEFAET